MQQVIRFVDDFLSPRPTPGADLSFSERKKALLATRLTLVVAGMSFFYMVVNLAVDLGIPFWVFAYIYVSSACVIFLNHRGAFAWAKAIGLLSFNFILFQISSSDLYVTGSHLYLIATGSAAFVLFGYEQRAWGLTFGIGSFLLYLLGYYNNWSVFDMKEYSSLQNRVFFFINWLIFSVVMGYLLYMLLRLNFKAENELRQRSELISAQNEQLTKTNRELDRFVYSASHDLRAPLSSIAGLVNLAKHDEKDRDTYLQLIDDRVQVMDAFIREIIDYARNARQEVSRTTLVLKPLVQQLIETIRHGAPPATEYEIDIADDFSVFTDEGRLRVILSNLIANAAKYHRPQQPCARVTIRARQAGSARIEVADNGMGIGPEHQTRIFEMFYRGTDRSGGSGLGLYIAREAAAKIGATIHFVSRLDEGSCFTVELPPATGETEIKS
ncbi:MAG: HAMP domain-containing histidine kinase [Cyclobacteriaceae bacterium]|nr:HAMP domain-containing histidine kinase [Cyclobacteriaceae bacterium]